MKRIASELIDEPLTITPLGAGNEVGRSCLIMKYKGKTIMLDCGIHPAHKGIAALPYFDEIDPSTIDMILITHFHLDHAAALPYFLSKTDFKGRVFMTHPTKSIYQLILQDYVRVSSIANPDPLYDEIDLNNSMDRIESINFHQTVNCNGIKFWAYNAGHVLGAAMFMIEIAGVKVLYTGDYSRADDRHLTGAEIPETKPDVLIIESTYGIQRLEPAHVREDRFTSLVKEILQRGGRCLIPVFALGRAQELLLILEEYWKANPAMHSYPVYYASSLAKKCMSVYKTYVNMMNSKVQKQFETANPFDFEHISYLRGMEDFHDVGPSVVFASPGMLQNGFSRQLFEDWCGDKRNGVIIPGYIVDGTLAKTIMMEPKEVESVKGTNIPLNMSVHYVTFSAHADFNDTSDFIDILNPPHIILVHGDSNEMSRLNNALRIQLKGQKTQVSTPKNCQTVILEFGTEKHAKVVGKLAEQDPQEEDGIEGVAVIKDYSVSIMSKEDIPKFTPLVCSTVFQSIKVPFSFSHECLLELISQVFAIEKQKTAEEAKKKIFTIIVSHNVKLSYHEAENFAIIEWMSGPLTDVIADALMAILVNSETLPSKAVARIVQKTKKNSSTPQEPNSPSGKIYGKTKKILKSVFSDAMTIRKSDQSIEISLGPRIGSVRVDFDLNVVETKPGVGTGGEKRGDIGDKKDDKKGDETGDETGDEREIVSESLLGKVESIVLSCRKAFEKIDYPKLNDLFDAGENGMANN